MELVQGLADTNREAELQDWTKQIPSRQKVGGQIQKARNWKKKGSLHYFGSQKYWNKYMGKDKCAENLGSI